MVTFSTIFESISAALKKLYKPSTPRKPRIPHYAHPLTNCTTYRVWAESRGYAKKGMNKDEIRDLWSKDPMLTDQGRARALRPNMFPQLCFHGIDIYILHNPDDAKIVTYQCMLHPVSAIKFVTANGGSSHFILAVDTMYNIYTAKEMEMWYARAEHSILTDTCFSTTDTIEDYNKNATRNVFDAESYLSDIAVVDAGYTNELKSALDKIAELELDYVFKGLCDRGMFNYNSADDREKFTSLHGDDISKVTPVGVRITAINTYLRSKLNSSASEF